MNTTTPVVSFDLEVGNVYNDFSLWKSKRPLTITCVGVAPLWDPLDPMKASMEHCAAFEGSGASTIWSGSLDLNNVARPLSQHTCLQLAQLFYAWHKQGVRIVTWNGLAFDFVVLADMAGPAAFEPLKEVALGPNHVDLMFNMFMHLGWNVSLNTAARETIDAGKEGLSHGQDAPLIWSLGRHEEVLEYCANDAKITRDLYLAAKRTGVIRWKTRGGRGVSKMLRAGRNWSSTWPVAKTLEQVEPPQLARFMSDPPTMKGFLELWQAPLERDTSLTLP